MKEKVFRTDPAPGYFDHNATAPMRESAVAAWIEAADRHWHNPSGLYREGAEARRVLEDLREELADLFGIEEPGRIVFTSGATEANNAAVAWLARSVPGAVAVSEIEHPCVAAAVDAYFGGARIRRIPVDPRSGAVRLDLVCDWIRRREVSAVAVMAANNETGALQPWRELSERCREAGLPFLCDAVQWIGRLPREGLGDGGFVVGSAHKFGGAKGVGFLILPEEGAGSFHGLLGGAQEGGQRGGTENLPGVAAMLAALREAPDGPGESVVAAQAAMRDAFERRLAGELGARILAEGGERLWNTSMFLLPRGRNVKWLARLGQRGFALSTGSACSAGKGDPSAVMSAMGLDLDEMGRVLRVSGGAETSPVKWEALADALVEVGGEIG